MKIINNETKEISCYTIDYENGLTCTVRISDEYTEYRYEFLGHRVYYFDEDYLNKIISREITSVPHNEFNKVFHSPNLTSSALQKLLFEFNEFNRLYKVSTRLDDNIANITEAMTGNRVPLIEELNLVEIYNETSNSIRDIGLIDFLDLCMSKDWILTRINRKLIDDNLYEKFMSTFKVRLIYPDDLNNELEGVISSNIIVENEYYDTIYNYIKLGRC